MTRRRAQGSLSIYPQRLARPVRAVARPSARALGQLEDCGLDLGGQNHYQTVAAPELGRILETAFQTGRSRPLPPHQARLEPSPRAPGATGGHFGPWTELRHRPSPHHLLLPATTRPLPPARPKTSLSWTSAPARASWPSPPPNWAIPPSKRSTTTRLRSASADQNAKKNQVQNRVWPRRQDLTTLKNSHNKNPRRYDIICANLARDLL